MLERLPCLHSPRWHLMQTSQILTSGALCQPLDDCNSRVCAFGCTSDHEPWLRCCIGEVFAHGKHEYMSAQRMTSFANSRLTCHQARSESEQADDARTVIWPRGRDRCRRDVLRAIVDRKASSYQEGPMLKTWCGYLRGGDSSSRVIEVQRDSREFVYGKIRRTLYLFSPTLG